MIRRTIISTGCLSAAATLICSMGLPSSALAQSTWKPDKNIEIVVPAAPGGGTDRTARVIQRIFQETRIVEVPAVVVNKPGGGGSIGWTYVAQQVGNPHFLAITQPALLTNFITGASKLNHANFTSIAQLSNEYIGFAVRADSEIKSGSDLVDRLKKDPRSIVFGVSNALGAPGHIALALVGRGLGVDIKKLKVVVFASGGESMVSLLGGHVDVIPTTVANLVSPVQGGKVRVVAVTAPRRLSGIFSQLPTWQEQGVNAVIGNWRGVVAPLKIEPTQVAFWESAFSRMTGSEQWKKDLERNSAEADFMNSADSRKFLDAQMDELRRVLSELDLAK